VSLELAPFLHPECDAYPPRPIASLGVRSQFRDVIRCQPFWARPAGAYTGDPPLGLSPGNLSSGGVPQGGIPWCGLRRVGVVRSGADAPLYRVGYPVVDEFLEPCLHFRAGRSYPPKLTMRASVHHQRPVGWCTVAVDLYW
jgi:hypothetical protein